MREGMVSLFLPPLENLNLVPRQQRGLFICWLQSSLHIVYFLFVGIFLLCLPWFRIWEDNYLLYQYPKLRPLISNHFFKGFVLGLGIANIIICIQEIGNFRKNLRRYRQQLMLAKNKPS